MLNAQQDGFFLDHLYSIYRDANKALPPFGKSDHNSIPLIPAYKQNVKREALLTRLILKSGQMKQMLNTTVLLAQTGIGSRILLRH
jgi:hypothetical protein